MSWLLVYIMPQVCVEAVRAQMFATYSEMPHGILWIRKWSEEGLARLMGDGGVGWLWLMYDGHRAAPSSIL